MKAADFFSLEHEDRVRRIVGEDCTFLAMGSTIAAATGGVGDRPCVVVATNPVIDRGALGAAEVADICRIVSGARFNGQAVIFVLDSAGARVSEGVAVQGALRALFAELVDARLAGVDMIAVLGRNVFGGASMLAMVCHHRLYWERSRLAMTGPAVLQARNSASMNDVGEVISGAYRHRSDEQSDLIADDAELCEGIANALRAASARHDDWLAANYASLRARLACIAAAGDAVGDVQIKDRRVRLRQSTSAGPRALMRVVEALETIGAHAEPVTIDCEWDGHSMALEDERLILSQYLVHLCARMRTLAALVDIHLNITGELSGGLYIVLAAGSTRVTLRTGASVLTLPQAVLDAFIELPSEPPAGAGMLRAHRVADIIES